MTPNQRNADLAKTKLRLAEKYDRLALDARSRRKKLQFVRKAQTYRRQARIALGERSD